MLYPVLKRYQDYNFLKKIGPYSALTLMQYLLGTTAKTLTWCNDKAILFITAFTIVDVAVAVTSRTVAVSRIALILPTPEYIGLNVVPLIINKMYHAFIVSNDK